MMIITTTPPALSVAGAAPTPGASNPGSMVLTQHSQAPRDDGRRHHLPQAAQ